MKTAEEIEHSLINSIKQILLNKKIKIEDKLERLQIIVDFYDEKLEYQHIRTKRDYSKEQFELLKILKQ